MQADLRTERFAPNLIESEPRVTVGHASIRQCSSRVAHRSIRFLIVRHSYSAFYQWKSSVATVDFVWRGGRVVLEKMSGGTLLAWVCPRGWEDEGSNMDFCMNPSHSVWFSSSASCYLFPRVQCLFQPILKAKWLDGPPRALNGTLLP